MQRVCGIQSPSDVIDQSIIVPDREFSALNIKELINVIRRRLHSQECLAQQLNALGNIENRLLTCCLLTCCLLFV